MEKSNPGRGALPTDRDEAERTHRLGLHSIGHEFGALDEVPARARVFGFWDQAVFWFSATCLPAAWYYGALMAGAQGMPSALLLVLVVSPLSLALWAILGWIAADSGACSTALIRPAFGLRGSSFPSVLYIFFGLGWAAVNVFLGAVGLSLVFSVWLKTPAYGHAGSEPVMAASIIVVAVTQGVIATAGHRVMRAVQWAATLALLVFGGWQTIAVLQQIDLNTVLNWRPPAGGIGFSIGDFHYTITVALLVDLLIAYNWTWEFIGDFSRFARSKTAGSAGPFVGANVAQTWWFLVGSILAVWWAVKNPFDAVTGDPSLATASLGLGLVAGIVIFASTAATNAGNLYASAVAVTNMAPRLPIRIRPLIAIVSAACVPVALLPLAVANLQTAFTFWLDVLGAVVVPLWVLVITDYLWVRRGRYSGDLFRTDGGAYWYAGGVNWRAVACLVGGTAMYWAIAYIEPQIRQAVPASLPVGIAVAVVYALLMLPERRAGSIAAPSPEPAS